MAAVPESNMCKCCEDGQLESRYSSACVTVALGGGKRATKRSPDSGIEQMMTSRVIC